MLFGFGELAAIGCCTTEDSKEKLKRQLCLLFGSLMIVLEKESGFTGLPVAESS